MSFFVRATKAPKCKTDNIRGVSLLLAGIIIVVVTCQLFGFGEYAGLIGDFLLPGGSQTASLVAAWLVITEVMALPFLLAMWLSPLMRYFSMVSGWLATANWVFLGLWLNLTDHAAANSGFLGTTVPLPAGWWLVSLALALGVLSAWASWGMWPGKIRRSQSKPSRRIAVQ